MLPHNSFWKSSCLGCIFVEGSTVARPVAGGDPQLSTITRSDGQSSSGSWANPPNHLTSPYWRESYRCGQRTVASCSATHHERFRSTQSCATHISRLSCLQCWQLPSRSSIDSYQSLLLLRHLHHELQYRDRHPHLWFHSAPIVLRESQLCMLPAPWRPRPNRLAVQGAVINAQTRNGKFRGLSSTWTGRVQHPATVGTSMGALLRTHTEITRPSPPVSPLAAQLALLRGSNPFSIVYWSLADMHFPLTEPSVSQVKLPTSSLALFSASDNPSHTATAPPTLFLPSTHARSLLRTRTVACLSLRTSRAPLPLSRHRHSRVHFRNMGLWRGKPFRDNGEINAKGEYTDLFSILVQCTGIVGQPVVDTLFWGRCGKGGACGVMEVSMRRQKRRQKRGDTGETQSTTHGCSRTWRWSEGSKYNLFSRWGCTHGTHVKPFDNHTVKVRISI